MNTRLSTNHNFKRMFVNILSIFVILVMAFPVVGSVSAQEPSPFIWADPLCECVNGWDWSDGDPITLGVFDQYGIPFILQTPTQTYSVDGGVFFDLGVEGIDLQPGYKVTMSNGPIIKELIISKLTVKEMNPVANTISGIRDPNLAVFVHMAGQDPLSYVFDGDKWIATFESLPLDGSGEAYQPDEDGDKTGMGWDSIPTFMRYDIYGFDVLSGNIQRITKSDGTGEYDPSWSPNGKKIAHDVVFWDGSHGIFVTDVRTGVSRPLVGANDGGNDAAWSPSGKWIAFDRRWYGEPNVYIVPDTGGDAMLVRSDAVTANWAPNSKRLVFQRPSDGSIWTAPLEEDKGEATIIAPNGSEPAWSPDGNWIAYVADDNIWKVPVNIQGKVLGDPIQVTHLSAWNIGGPTWSLDSQTIFFNGGVMGDSDIWNVSAMGGEPIWSVGAPESGDYGPENVRNSASIAYASNSPDGLAPRQWVAAYTYDPPVGTFDEGTHPYHFDFEWNTPEPGSWSGQGGDFVISDDAEIRDGYVLLRGPAEIHGINYPDGFSCEPVGEINPSQPTRFLIGWVPGVDEAIEMTYPEAKAHFESITANAVWDDGSAELERHEIIPLREDTWFDYVCTFTEAPRKMDLRVNYGHDWVESFYEAGHAVSIHVTDREGNVKATAEVFTGSREEWGGEPGFQTTPENWSPAPPDLQPYDWVYAQVDNGATARVQLGDIQGEVNFQTDSVTGTIVAPWITDPIQVECLDWGSGQEPPFSNKDGGFRFTDGSDQYSCSWEGEWDVQPWQDIGVGYFTPDGNWVANAFRDERWMAFWTYDPPAQLFGEGEHSYYYEWAYTVPVSDSGTSGPRTMTVVGDPTPIYDGYALLGPWDYMPQQAWTGSACEVVEALHPNQPMRFVWGWVNDYSMTYEEALAHFISFTIDVFWDGEAGGSAALTTISELVPFTGRPARLDYLCTLTEHP